MFPISTARCDFSRLHASNVSASSITAPLPTATEPVATIGGVLSMSPSAGLETFNAAVLQFYGARTSADNETFTARVTGWRFATDLWVPVPLLALALIQGTSVGVAGKTVVATEYFADTITVSTAFTTAYEIINPADNTIACVKVDALGCKYVQVDLAKGTNATCNVLGAGF